MDYSGVSKTPEEIELERVHLAMVTRLDQNEPVGFLSENNGNNEYETRKSLETSKVKPFDNMSQITVKRKNADAQLESYETHSFTEDRNKFVFIATQNLKLASKSDKLSVI